jgi:iron complex transport system substrate-binding protein
MKRPAHRIVSLLPSATEIACALGLAEELVGITHCCDHPRDQIAGKPVVVRSALPVDEMSLREIDVAVSGRLRRGESLYLVDEELLRELAPTLLLTQDLCQVCAPSGNEVSRAVQSLEPKPRVLWMSPHSLADIHSDIVMVGEATERMAEARQIVASMERRVEEVRRKCARAPRPRVFCAEWLDPLYCSGHWVPEMVEIAGGHDVLGRTWKDSVRVAWDSVRAADPEVIIVMACGMSCAEAADAAEWLRALPVFDEVSAARNGRFFAVDAAYFSTPGPRVAEGVELLAHLIHPELSDWHGSGEAFATLDCESYRAAQNL